MLSIVEELAVGLGEPIKRIDGVLEAMRQPISPETPVGVEREQNT